MNPVKLSDIEIQIPNIPDDVPSLSDLPSLIDRYKILFRGFDSFQPDQFVMRYELDLEWVLQDLITCMKCSGECQTKYGHCHFLKIDWEGMQFSGNSSMSFTVGECPGVMERKEQIKDLLAGKGVITYQAPDKPMNRISELKEQLKGRPKVVELEERRKRANEWID